MNGKGMSPRKGYNQAKYLANYDLIFGKRQQLAPARSVGGAHKRGTGKARGTKAHGNTSGPHGDTSPRPSTPAIRSGPGR